MTLETIILVTSTPIFITGVLLEWKLAQKDCLAYPIIGNIYTLIIYSILDFSFRFIGLNLLSYFSTLTLVEIGQFYWILLFVSADFCYWCMHFMSHNCRFFWMTHSVHHSSNEFNLTVALRSDIFQVFTKFIYFIPLAFFGFKAEHIMLVYLISQIYGNFLHTNHTKSSKWIEYLLITPSLHRVHHSSELLYLDRNMGMVFSVWDRLFGTFQKEVTQVKYFGVLEERNNSIPLKIFSHEFIKMSQDMKRKTTLTNKLKYLFYPPGWSHDGSRKTTVQLKKELSS